jgi:death-on-curing protein
MLILTTAEVIELHDKLIDATGGLSGVRDFGLLESAVLGCYESFFHAKREWANLTIP